MLKKIGLGSVLFCLILLIACNNQNESNNETDKNKEEKPVEEKEDAAQDDQENEQVEEETDQKETLDDSEEQTVEKEPEILYEIDENSELSPLEEGTNEKVLLLTIDDVPDENAVDMAKTLKDLDAPAIFFVNGHFLESKEKKAMLQEIHEMGFAIGNHTYSHANLQEVDQETQKEEILKVSQQIKDIIGEKPEFFRAPHGANTDFSTQLVEDEGMVQMNWTYGYDYFKPYMDKDKITEAMISGEGPEVDVDYSLLHDGANLLMHDRDWTAAALEDIVTGLRDKGFEMADPATIKKFSNND